MFDMMQAGRPPRKGAGPGEYRYVRLAILIGPQYTTLGELEIRSEAGGTNWCREPGTIASASGNWGAPYSPAGMIDGRNVTDTNSSWCVADTNQPNSNRTCWWQVDLNQPRLINSVRLAVPDFGGRNPSSIVVLGSNDNLEWIDLSVKTGLTWTSLVFKELM